MAEYSGAIAQLLTYGECTVTPIQEWVDYASLGLTPADIPQLIQMATDPELYEAELDSIEGWAPVHAWRALAQLRAGVAVEPLLQAYERFGEQDGWWEWFSDELPDVFTMMGEAAIPGIRNYVSYQTQSAERVSAQLTAIGGLEKIGKANPELQPQCIEICTTELTHASEHDPEVNGFLVGVLPR